MRQELELAAFMYHEVTDDPDSPGFQRPGALPYKHSVQAFTEHLELIAKAGAKTALYSEIDCDGAGQYVLLTFDDGGKSALLAAELLARRGWLGHFFIVSSLIGTRTFLSAGELRELQQGGHALGSHSHTHPNIFREQTRDQMVTEWQTSRDILEQILGEPCLTASVPGGESSPAVLDSASRVGFTHLFTSEPWLTPRRVGNCLALGRFSVKTTTPSTRLETLLRFRGWQTALLERRLKSLAKRVLPGAYRRYVGRRTDTAVDS
jgi:peptidoglycan/xylan/chitin deacetylase (PgdA/CDA1 family)